MDFGYSLVTGAGQVHRHSIFTRRPQGAMFCGLFCWLLSGLKVTLTREVPVRQRGHSIGSNRSRRRSISSLSRSA